jgi:hypothetical protein
MGLLRIGASGEWNHVLLPTARGVLLAFGLTTVSTVSPGPRQEKIYLDVLKEIYDEVKEMGPYPGEDFIRREFFVGEDDDDTNKDVHVVVLIQRLDLKETMTIRVTEMVKDPGNVRARLARNSRMLVCLLAGDRLEIRSSDYEENDLDKLAPEILTAIQNKKRLLKLNLCGSGRPG